MMKLQSLIVVVAGISLCLSGCGEKKERESVEIKSLESVSTRTSQEDLLAECLGQKDIKIAISGPDGPHKVEGEILWTTVKCTYKQGPNDARQQEIECYILKAVNENIDFYCVFAAVCWIDEIRVFPHDPGNNYVAWVQGGWVYIQKARDSRSVKEAIKKDVLANPAREGAIAVPVVQLCGGRDERHFWGADGLPNPQNQAIKILSLTPTDAGGFQLTVKGEGTGKTFDLFLTPTDADESEGGGWRFAVQGEEDKKPVDMVYEKGEWKKAQ